MTAQVPFVFQVGMRYFEYADFWTGAFGVEDDSELVRTNVRAVVRDFLVKYVRATSYNDCVAQEGSFYYDGAAQQLYIHSEHACSPTTAIYEYGYAFGVTDESVTYIDDYEYLPLLKSVPNAAQSADPVNAVKPRLVSGDAQMINVGGRLDWALDEHLYGNHFFLYDYEEGGSLVPVACFWIEDYSYSKKAFTLHLQDMRTAQDVKVPTKTMTRAEYPYLDDSDVGKCVPLLLGAVQAVELTPINPSYLPENAAVSAIYRLPDGCTSVGTVQVEIEDDAWAPAIGVVVDWVQMLMSVTNSRDEDGGTRRLRLLNPVGVMYGGHSYPADLILDLNYRYRGIQFTASNYDTTEWTAEAASSLIAADVGMLLDEPKPISDWIMDLCGKGLSVFRYEFTPDGRATIRARDLERAPVRPVIQACEIMDGDECEVDTDSENVFSSVKVLFAHNHAADTDLSIVDSTWGNSVRSRYRVEEQKESATLLQTLALAQQRAAAEARAYSEISRVVSLELFGHQDLKVFETLDVSLKSDDFNPAARQYLGERRVMVLSINPSKAHGRNSITALLKPEYSSPSAYQVAHSTSFNPTSRPSAQALANRITTAQESATAAAAAAALAQSAAAEAAKLAGVSLSLSDPAISLDRAGVYHPASITASAQYASGEDYLGRIRIEFSEDGAAWTTAYESATDESEASVALAACLFVRASLFEAGSFSVIMRSVAVHVSKDTSARYLGPLAEAPTDLTGLIENDSFFLTTAFASGGGRIYYLASGVWVEADHDWPLWFNTFGKALGDVRAWMKDNAGATGDLVSFTTVLVETLAADEAMIGKLSVDSAFIAELFSQSIDVAGRIRYYNGEGVNKRAVQLADSRIDFLDTPVGGIEALIARLGRLGVGGDVLFDGTFRAPTTAPWSAAATVVAAGNYPSTIQLNDGTFMMSRKNTTSGYLVMATRASLSAAWSAETVINAAATSHSCLKQFADGTIKVYYCSAAGVCERTYDKVAGTWGAQTVINAVEFNAELDVVERKSGQKRICYATATGLDERTQASGSSVWSAAATVAAGANSACPSYIERKNGQLRLAYSATSTGYLKEMILNEGTQAWGAATTISAENAASPSYVETLGDELWIAYTNASVYIVIRKYNDKTSAWGAAESPITGVISLYANMIQLNSGQMYLSYRSGPANAIVEQVLERYIKIGGGIEQIHDNSNGRAIKFSDGTMICYRILSTLVGITVQQGSVYFGSSAFTFPTAFSEAPDAIVPIVKLSAYNYWGGGYTGNTTTGVSVLACSPVNAGACYLGYIAIGKWK